MTFGYDLCTYLSAHSDEWDDNVVTGGFSIAASTAATSDPRWQDITQANTSSDSEYANDIIYLNQQPNSRTNCICVFDTGGYEAGRFHGTSEPLEQPTAQIKVRHSSMSVAESTARCIYEMLDELYYATINSRQYMSINAIAPPYYVGVDNTTTAGQAYSYTLNLYGKLIRT